MVAGPLAGNAADTRTQSVEHLEDNVRAAALKLAPADLKDLA